jgi:hypothetical protein
MAAALSGGQPHRFGLARLDNDRATRQEWRLSTPIGPCGTPSPAQARTPSALSHTPSVLVCRAVAPNLCQSTDLPSSSVCRSLAHPRWPRRYRRRWRVGSRSDRRWPACQVACPDRRWHQWCRPRGRRPEWCGHRPTAMLTQGRFRRGPFRRRGFRRGPFRRRGFRRGPFRRRRLRPGRLHQGRIRQGRLSTVRLLHSSCRHPRTTAATDVRVRLSRRS